MIGSNLIYVIPCIDVYLQYLTSSKPCISIFFYLVYSLHFKLYRNLPKSFNSVTLVQLIISLCITSSNPNLSLKNCSFHLGVSLHFKNTVELHLSGSWLSGSPIIRIGLAVGIKLSKLKKKKKLTCPEIIGYRIKHSTVLRLLELQIWRGRKVRTVNSNIRTSNCQFNLFSKKNPIIRIFCICGWLDVPINPDKCSIFLFQYAGSIFLL